MAKFTFVDRAPMYGMRDTELGYYAGTIKAARTGIQQYLGSEVGRPELSVVNVYRPAEEVFKRDSMASFVGKPVTIGHPDELVTSENWKDLAHGQIGTDVARDGEAIQVSIALMDKAAIDLVKSEDGPKEVSMGYRADIVWGDGIAPDGTPFQAKQTNIIVDHIAVVKSGRAGKDFRIGDSQDGKQWGAAPITVTDADERNSNMETLRTMDVNGFSIQVNDAAVSAITKLLGDVKAAEQKLVDQLAANTALVATKDTEIGELKAKLADAEKAILTPEMLDKKVADRAELITVVKAIDDTIVTDGKTDVELKRAAVAVKHGDAFKDASEAEISGAFRVIASDTKKAIEDYDPAREAIRGGVVQTDGAPGSWDDNVFAMAGITPVKKGA